MGHAVPADEAEHKYMPHQRCGALGRQQRDAPNYLARCHPSPHGNRPPRPRAPRSGRNVGRSVEAFGFWGDILNGPYHCFGTTASIAPDRGLFRTMNKEFAHSAMDVAEHNVQVRRRTHEGGAASDRWGWWVSIEEGGGSRCRRRWR